jgi:hypothetical protein
MKSNQQLESDVSIFVVVGYILLEAMITPWLYFPGVVIAMMIAHDPGDPILFTIFRGIFSWAYIILVLLFVIGKWILSVGFLIFS